MSKPPTDKLLPDLASWELPDLRDLHIALTALIEAREASVKHELAEDHDIDAPEVDKPSNKQARGHIEAKYIPRGNKRHGPYLYLRYWQGGKLRSKYLGKPAPNQIKPMTSSLSQRRNENLRTIEGWLRRL